MSMNDDNLFMKPYLGFRLTKLTGRGHAQGIISITCDEMFDITGGTVKGILLQGTSSAPSSSINDCRVLITPEILADFKLYIAWIEGYMASGKPFTEESEIQGFAEH